jgi:hypothetical protein
MAYDDLRQFLKALDEQGQLLRITEEVMPEPDIAAAANAAPRLGDNAPALAPARGTRGNSRPSSSARRLAFHWAALKGRGWEGHPPGRSSRHPRLEPLTDMGCLVMRMTPEDWEADIIRRVAGIRARRM